MWDFRAWTLAGILQMVGLLLALWFARLHVLPSLRLLAKTVHRDHGPLGRYVTSTADLIRIFLMVGLREKLYRAARLTVEWEILNPRPALERAESAGLTVRVHGLREATRRRDHAVASVVEQFDWNRKALRTWRNERRRRVASLLDPDVASPVITVDDVFKVYSAADGIEHYFDTLAAESSILVDQRTRFLSHLKVSEGFIAPLHLVAGLNSRFDEDWTKVLSPYDALGFAGGDEAPLVAFQFVCWLMWGPSIPICTCRRWRGWSDRPVLQYGYGDESNSLSVLVEPEGASQAVAGATAEPADGIVRRVGLEGSLHWGPGIASGDLAPAQQDIASTDEGRLVLRCTRLPHAVGGTGGQVRARYYSAYLWIMFAVEGDTFETTAGPWSRLLPFFEHGNLADSDTLSVLKERLVSKVMRFLETRPSLALRYVCAVDDSACFEDGQPAPVRFPEPSEQTLRARLAARLAGSRPGVFPDESTLRRDGNAFSSCALQEVIDDFVRTARRQVKR